MQTPLSYFCLGHLNQNTPSHANGKKVLHSFCVPFHLLILDSCQRTHMAAQGLALSPVQSVSLPTRKHNHEMRI